MTYQALIPVKLLREAKSRLAGYLTPEQRARLVLDMLHHVINTLQASQTLTSIAVVSSDNTILEYAANWGARALPEKEHGHNPALATAARQIARETSALLTISADLPLLRPQDIHHMMALSTQYDVVLASSSEGQGTNALLVRPPLAISYVFGLGSLGLYQEQARRRGLSSTLYTTINTALDIDTIDDLEQLQRYERNSQITHLLT